MANLKLIISSNSVSVEKTSIWLGAVWEHIRKQLFGVGAFSKLVSSNYVSLLYSFDSCVYTASSSSSDFKFFLRQGNNAGFDGMMQYKLNIQQSFNTGYSFLSSNESFICLSLPNIGVAQDILLTIAMVLIDNGYNAFFYNPDGMTDNYTILTKTLISEVIDPTFTERYAIV